MPILFVNFDASFAASPSGPTGHRYTSSGIHGPGLLNQHGGHLLGRVGISQVGTSGDAEITAATGTRGVDPLEGAHVVVHVVADLQAVFSIDSVGGEDGEALSAEVEGRSDLDIARAVGPLESGSLVVGPVVVAADNKR